MYDTLINLIFTLLIFGTIALLYYLANQSIQEPLNTSKKVLGWSIQGIISMGFFFLFLLGVFLHISTIFPIIGEMLHITGMNPADLSATLRTMGIVFWLPSIIAISFLLPFVQRWITKGLPLQPGNHVHVITLMLSMTIIIQMAFTYAIGIDTLNAMESPNEYWHVIISIWTQDLMFVLISFVGVGWLTRRNGREALKRLGLEKLTFHQLIYGILIALFLVLMVNVLEILFAQLGWGFDPDVEEYTEKLIGPLFTTIPGILTLGFAAALGEEILFRGALQPRFGIVLTSVLFALVHSNYGITLSTLIVFGVGLCLGFVRVKWNTTTAMVIHATYNICLGFLAFMQ